MTEPNVNSKAGGTELRSGKTLPEPRLAQTCTHGDTVAHPQDGAGSHETEDMALAVDAQPAPSEIDKLAQLMTQQQEFFMSMIQNMQQQINQASSARIPERIPSSSLPEKAEYHMPIQQWRIWRRDIQRYAEMAGWSPRTTVLNIRLQCDDKLKRVIEA